MKGGVYRMLTKNGYPHILFGYYHPVRAVRFFFLRP